MARRFAWVWLVAAGLGLIAAVCYLLIGDLLWTVHAPTAVAIAVLCLGTAPTIGFVIHRRGKSWWVVPLAWLLASVVGAEVPDLYLPSDHALGQQLVATGVPALAGAGPVRNSGGCRFFCDLPTVDEETGSSVSVSFETNDVLAVCQSIVEHLTEAGWSTVRSALPAHCGAGLTRPAPMGLLYWIDVSAPTYEGRLPGDNPDAPPVMHHFVDVFLGTCSPKPHDPPCVG